MRPIFLIGYMGAGKTTLGKLLAERMNLHFIDLDWYIEQRYHRTVNELFREHGENGFRNIEKNMLREVGEFEDVLIASGGGTPCFYDNMAYMNNKGVAVYLKNTVETLYRRLKAAKASRPLLRDKSDKELRDFIEENLIRRSSYYESCSLIFDANNLDDYRNIPGAAEQLNRQIENYLLILDK